MRITQWGEYGVHLAVYLAERGREGAPISAAEIAAAQGIALQYAQQILLRLREGGVVESVRGPGGGYLLADEPSKITLYDVILATEGDTLELICESKPLSPERCGSQVQCSLRPVWYGLREQVDVYLKGISLEDLVQTLIRDTEPVQLPRRSALNLEG